MKTILTTTLILCLSGSAGFAQGPSLTISYADQEKTMLERICSGAAATGQEAEQDWARAPDMAKRDADFSGILAKSLLLSDDQKRKLKDYEDAQAKAIADAKSRLCANPPDLSSFEASLNFRQKMIEDQLETVKAINPKLIAFYNGLNPEQKNKFDQMREHLASQRKR